MLLLAMPGCGLTSSDTTYFVGHVPHALTSRKAYYTVIVLLYANQCLFNPSQATEQYCAAGTILLPLCLSKQLTLCTQQHIDQFVSWSHSVCCLLTSFSCNAQHLFLHNMCTVIIGERVNVWQIYIKNHATAKEELYMSTLETKNKNT